MTYKTYREAGTVAGYLASNTDHPALTVRADGMFHVWTKGRKAKPSDLQPHHSDVAAFTYEHAVVSARQISEMYSDDGVTGLTIAPHPNGEPSTYAITFHVNDAHLALTTNDLFLLF